MRWYHREGRDEKGKMRFQAMFAWGECSYFMTYGGADASRLYTKGTFLWPNLLIVLEEVAASEA